VQLYSGMFLQAFFFASNIYGWFVWRKQLAGNEAPTILSTTKRWSLVIITAALTIAVGLIVQKLPTFYPEFFPKPASQPYYDAFIAIASISGQIMLTRRISDNWFVWLIVNAVSVLVFFRQGLYLLTIEYVLFLLLSIKGIIEWRKAVLLK
jgi:nicotinamide mononucleotide transporter